MKNNLFIINALFVLVAGSSHSWAADNSQNSLFNPTPRDQMRKFSTDQTTFTLNPYTVDAGHFQIEADFADYVYDKQGSVKSEGWIFGWSTFKAGLCNRADLEVSINAYSSITTRDRATGIKMRDTGFGDTRVGSKINLWGNDEGTTGLAILPFVNIPTSSGNKDYSGGVYLPFLAKIPCDFELGLMTGVRLYESTDLHASFVNSISLRRVLVGRLLGYGEFFTSVYEETDTWEAFANSGLAYQFTDNFQLHGGITFNVHNSTDYNPYLGFSWRF